jgi:hypothetical protein
MSIFRLYACVVAGLSHTNNYSQDYLAMSKWSTIELNVGIWCACMPTLRVLLVRLFPKVLGTSKRYLNYGSNKTGAKQGNNDGSNHSKGRIRSKLDPLAVGVSYQVGKAAQHHTRVDPIGITCDRTYGVDYGLEEDDETYLVHMKAMDHNHKGSNSLAQSEDSV